MKSNKYYREPNVVIQRPSDMTYAFTMRLLNFLGSLEVWGKDNTINPRGVEAYAEKRDALLARDGS